MPSLIEVLESAKRIQRAVRSRIPGLFTVILMGILFTFPHAPIPRPVDFSSQNTPNACAKHIRPERTAPLPTRFAAYSSLQSLDTLVRKSNRNLIPPATVEPFGPAIPSADRPAG